MTVELKDMYLASRQPNGVLVPDICEVANPQSIPVVVLRYIHDERDSIAIYHSDLHKIEVSGRLRELSELAEVCKI